MSSEKSLTRSMVETGLKVAGWVLVIGVGILVLKWLGAKAGAAIAT